MGQTALGCLFNPPAINLKYLIIFLDFSKYLGYTVRSQRGGLGGPPAQIISILEKAATIIPKKN